MQYSQEDLELEFCNGSCGALAKKLNEKYGYVIYHVFMYNLNDDFDEENGIIHSLVKFGENFLDITGLHTAKEIIDEWYYNTGEIRKDTEIFLVSDSLKHKIIYDGKITTKVKITLDDKVHYKLTNYAVNTDYEGQFDIDNVCENLVKSIA